MWLTTKNQAGRRLRLARTNSRLSLRESSEQKHSFCGAKGDFARASQLPDGLADCGTRSTDSAAMASRLTLAVLQQAERQLQLQHAQRDGPGIR